MGKLRYKGFGFKVPFFAFQATQGKLVSGFLNLGFWISDFGFIESLRSIEFQ